MEGANDSAFRPTLTVWPAEPPSLPPGGRRRAPQAHRHRLHQLGPPPEPAAYPGRTGGLLPARVPGNRSRQPRCRVRFRIPMGPPHAPGDTTAESLRLAAVRPRLAHPPGGGRHEPPGTQPACAERRGERQASPRAHSLLVEAHYLRVLRALDWPRDPHGDGRAACRGLDRGRLPRRRSGTLGHVRDDDERRPQTLLRPRPLPRRRRPASTPPAPTKSPYSNSPDSSPRTARSGHAPTSAVPGSSHGSEVAPSTTRPVTPPVSSTAPPSAPKLNPSATAALGCERRSLRVDQPQEG